MIRASILFYGGPSPNPFPRDHRKEINSRNRVIGIRKLVLFFDGTMFLQPTGSVPIPTTSIHGAVVPVQGGPNRPRIKSGYTKTEAGAAVLSKSISTLRLRSSSWPSVSKIRLPGQRSIYRKDASLRFAIISSPGTPGRAITLGGPLTWSELERRAMWT